VGTVGGVAAEPALLPVLEPIQMFLGTWRGEGRGVYPTIEPFAYVEETQFWHAGKPFLGYQQRSRLDTGAPSHAESGFFRAVGPADPAGATPMEVVIAHPSGLSELLVGTATPGCIRVGAGTVVRTATAKEVTAVERTMEVRGDELTYEVHMAAVGQPLQLHLTATLHRVS
jgi:hypothetical protein